MLFTSQSSEIQLPACKQFCRLDLADLLISFKLYFTHVRTQFCFFLCILTSAEGVKVQYGLCRNDCTSEQTKTFALLNQMIHRAQADLLCLQPMAFFIIIIFVTSFVDLGQIFIKLVSKFLYKLKLIFIMFVHLFRSNC